MSKYYTGKGDDGLSQIISNSKIQKDDILLSAIGDVDELNSIIAVSLFYIKDNSIINILEEVQNSLFSVGAVLASVDNPKSNIDFAYNKVTIIESYINKMGSELPDLKKFVLPNGSEASRYLHFSRAVARKAERSVITANKSYKINNNIIAYLNRLSSLLFVCALYINYKEGLPEKNPKYL
jgi:cob(I)alamin adenosyltransferase